MKWTALLHACFESTQYMTLATNGPKGLWANPVYFAWDEKYALYFISQMNTNHVENLLAQPHVACTIFPTNQDTLGNIIGAYMTGAAQHVTDTEGIKKADAMYYERVHGNDEQAKSLNGYRLSKDWHFFKITPTGFWYFDTRHFGETRTQVPQDLWT